MTEPEIQDVGNELLDGMRRPEPDLIELPEEYDIRNIFLLVAWDTVTGIEWQDAFATFDHAVRWLLHREADHDLPFRVDGGATGTGLAYRGSGDKVGEHRRSEQFRVVATRVLVDAARRGYSARHGDRLSSLSNRVLMTTRIEVFSFIGDLAWRASAIDGQLDNVECMAEEVVDIPGGLREWVRSLRPEPDPRGPSPPCGTGLEGSPPR